MEVYEDIVGPIAKACGYMIEDDQQQYHLRGALYNSTIHLQEDGKERDRVWFHH